MKNQVTRRQFLGILGAAGGTALLAACAPQAPAEPTAAATAVPVQATEEPVATAVPSAEAVTLVHWDFGGGEMEYLDTTTIPAFYEAHPEITIEHVGIPEDGFSTKMTTAISSGTPPDVALNFDNRLYKAGLCFALDDQLEAAGIDWKTDWYLPIAQGDLMIDDGKIYAMPTEAAPSFGAFNKDLFEAAGLEPLSLTESYDYATWYAIAKAINKASDTITERIWGVDLFNPTYSVIKYGQSSPKWCGDDGRTVVGNMDSPGWLDMYQQRVAVWKEELAPIGDEAEGLGGNPFSLGQMGLRKGYYDQITADREAGINCDPCQVPCIAPDKGSQGIGAWTGSWTIFKATKFPDQAWTWVHFLGTEGARIWSGMFGPPPMSKKLTAEMNWAADKPDGEAILAMLELLPARPFVPSFAAVAEPLDALWTRITEGGEEIEPALQETAAEMQTNLDNAWEEWEAMAQ